ncbi:7TM diverse intracellular signaling domain-containing protein [Variovorax sp. J2P1-59]|uniref:sensor histidine kinase n=1 Tax=Variovorax flavidus TaxID=3053501 RepID=UPI00257631E8|nr:ATP-binding protein [Variovorax sp. J2P1-59]MDM0074292.1 7TM diverse intracellular signaling domain-containing protein [Variovorax sp. J2P1-59]
MSHLPISRTWLAALIGLWLWLSPLAPGFAQEARPPLMRLVEAEAVRGGWNDATPPKSGWTPVALPDNWDARWPDFDGTVWYRLTWDQPAPLQPTGLMLRYLAMAGAVYLNGTPISRDPHLVEPLTRSWNTPRYWLLAPPLLQEGRNTLLVRVSGIAAYQPGLGPFTLGSPAAVQALYDGERLVRRDLQMLGLAVSSTLVVLFGTLWVMRRRETAYGWFAVVAFLWLLFGLNQVVTTPWPFRSTDGWQAFSTSLLLAFTVAFTLFTLRFCQQRLPRFEALVVLVAAAGCLHLWLTPPGSMAAPRLGWTLASALTLFFVCFAFLGFALRHGRAEHRVLAPFMAVVVIATGHDLLVFTKILKSNIYYAVMSSYVPLLGLALILAWRFVGSLQRIETFNSELVMEIEAAKAEAAATLEAQHRLQVAHARIGERVNLVSDLHDGLGGMLVGSIATLEQTPDRLSAPQLLRMLKSLQEDLRLIIDATVRHDDARSLAEMLAPLRHRVTQLLDANGIECRWQLAGVDALELTPSQNLDVMRFLQEAVTNALKHSGARNVDVSLQHDGGALRITVGDDGRGFVIDEAARSGGAGMRSMHMRARRLGAELHMQSRPGDTRVTLQLKMQEDAGLRPA